MPLSDAKILNVLTWTVAALLGLAAAGEIFFPGLASTLDTVIILLATVASVATVNKQLPLQNVLFAAAITALIGGAAHGLSAQTGIPLGPLTFGDTADRSISTMFRGRCRSCGLSPFSIRAAWHG